MNEQTSENIHATCVAIGDDGVLLLGPSGTGKSDLALRLIEDGAVLVGDDRVQLTPEGNGLTAGPVPELEGLLEVRGVGIVRRPFRARVRIAIAISLSEIVPRLPEATHTVFCGREIRSLSLNAFEASTPAKIRVALGGVVEGG